MTRLMIIGGGRMGEALLGGLITARWADPGELHVVEPDAQRAAELADTHPGVVVSDTAAPAEGAIIAVKPHLVTTVAAQLGDLGINRVLSIAAGVRVATIVEASSPGCAVIRAMPNTPALVGAGAIAITGGPGTSDDDLDWAEALLGTVGVVIRVEEHLMDVVTGLSGSGPAYVFLMIEALIEAAVLNGLDRPTAERLSVQTVLGSALLASRTNTSAAELRAAVTSPGGTTAAGLAELEHAGMRAAILDAVTAATRRSGELG